MTVRVFQGDCRDVLRTLPGESVHSVVTSPPYWGLRDYGIPPGLWDDDPECDHVWGEHIAVNATNHTTKARWNHTRNGRDELQPPEKRVSWLRTEVKQGQFCQLCGAWAGCLGLEPTYQMYIEHMVEVSREARRVLRADGTLWLNLGDSYATGAGKVGSCPGGGEQGERWKGNRGIHTVAQSGKNAPRVEAMGPMIQPNRMPQPGLKPKDLCGIPWRVALALQADGWWLRQDIIWSKPNPMPESVTDRCTKAHEYLFLLAKTERYYYDADAISESLADSSLERLTQPNLPNQHGSARVPGKTNGPMKAVGRAYSFARKTATEGKPGAPAQHREDREEISYFGKRNRRSVWEIATQPFSEAHFATFPPALIEPCILAGCPKGGTVLDPFFGAGTTGLVADRLGRNCIGIELNPAYVEIAQRRIKGDCPMFSEVI